MRPFVSAIIALFFVFGVVLSAVPAGASHTGDATECEFPVSETDHSGTQVTLEAPAESVVVTDASSTQVFWELDASDVVVGVPVEEYTAYLEGASEKVDVTDGQQILVERIIELDPDLVIVPNYADETTIQQLRESGLTVYQLGLEDSIVAIYQKTRLYGHFIGECEAAEATVAEMQSELTAIESAAEGRDRPRVLYYFFGYTAGEDTFIHDLVTIAGGANVAAQAGIQGYEEVSDEVVVEADPEWIVSPSHSGLPEEAAYESTTAMQENQTLVVDENLVSQAAPRVVIPVRQMAEAFHPAAFESDTTEATGPETGQPEIQEGLGVVIALVGGAAILLLLFVYWRRR